MRCDRAMTSLLLEDTGQVPCNSPVASLAFQGPVAYGFELYAEPSGATLPWAVYSLFVHEDGMNTRPDPAVRVQETHRVVVLKL